VVRRHTQYFWSTTAESSNDGIGVGDGARGEYRDDGIYGTESQGADGMRGHGVGVGDVGEVQGWVWVQKDAPGGDDGRVTVGKCEPGVVG
jgi:hypothetical protein